MGRILHSQQRGREEIRRQNAVRAQAEALAARLKAEGKSDALLDALTHAAERMPPGDQKDFAGLLNLES